MGVVSIREVEFGQSTNSCWKRSWNARKRFVLTGARKYRILVVLPLQPQPELLLAIPDALLDLVLLIIERDRPDEARRLRLAAEDRDGDAVLRRFADAGAGEDGDVFLGGAGGVELAEDGGEDAVGGGGTAPVVGDEGVLFVLEVVGAEWGGGRASLRARPPKRWLGGPGERSVPRRTALDS